LSLSTELAHKKAETLMYLCYSHLGLAAYPPSLIAVASILTALRPTLDTLPVSLLRDTPSPSSTSSASSLTSSPPSVAPKPGTSVAPPPIDADPLSGVMAALERLSLGEAAQVRQCMERLEELMSASLPPSPAGSDDDDESPVIVGSRRSYYAAVAAAAASTSTPLHQSSGVATATASRSLFTAAARASLLEGSTDADPAF
jgi:hypothetical protein